MSYNDMKARIAALKDKADNHAASEAEAMSAATLAEKLMRKHGITIADIERSRVDGGASIKTKNVQTNRLRQHEVDLLCIGAIETFTDTKSYVAHCCIDGIRQWCPVFVGYGPEVDLAIWLRETIKRAMESEWRKFQAGENYQKGRGRRQRRQFIFAMGIRIARRLTKMKEARTVAAQETQSGNALIIAKSEIVNAAFRRATGKLEKPSKLAAVAQGVASEAGRAAGQSVSLGRPVSSTNGHALLTR